MLRHRMSFVICLILCTPSAPGTCTAASAPQGASVGTSAQCGTGGQAPSRDGFFNEVLFAEASSRTPRFDDYTPGSYHVNKWDLAQGLPQQARLCGVNLKAMLVVGPVGVLWTYHVAALIAEDSNVRVNALVMPHARVTGKGTGLLSPDEAASLLHAIRTATPIRPGVPSENETIEAEFSYRLLLAIYGDGDPEYFYADIDDDAEDPDTRTLLDRVNNLLATASTTTY